MDDRITYPRDPDSWSEKPRVAKSRFASADDRLSRAASAVWRISEHAWMDYALDGSGELGGVIARGHNRFANAAVAEFGFDADSYNAALRARLAPEYPAMSYATFRLLGELEVESEAEYDEANTFVATVGFAGHPGAEFSSVAYLKESA